MHIRTMEDVIRDDYARIYRQKYKKDMAEATAAARARARAEIRSETKAEEKQETAIRLLKKGTSIDLIQIATELPIAAINDIAKSLKLPIAAPISS